MSVRRYETIALGLLKKEELEEEKKKNAKIAIFYFARCVRKLALYSNVIHLFDWKSAVNLRYIAMLYTYSIGNQP